jgi:gliding motility-associated-like protein
MRRIFSLVHIMLLSIGVAAQTDGTLSSQQEKREDETRRCEEEISGQITPAAANICEGGYQDLSVKGGFTYEWQLNGETIPGEKADHIRATRPGTYTVIIRKGKCKKPASNSAVITLIKPAGSITPQASTICAGGSQVLTTSGGDSYTWMRDGVEIPSEHNATLVVSQGGTYKVVIKKDGCANEASNKAVIKEESKDVRYPDVEATRNVAIQLNARQIGVAYLWSPAAGLDDATSQSPTAVIDVSREYTVQITTENSCVVTDTVLIKVPSESAERPKQVFVPTAFTPNGNNVNERLRPLGKISTLRYFKVFNRWGQLVFTTSEYGTGWDGSFNGAHQPTDTYTWILLAESIDGSVIKLSGKTLLIR